MRTFSQRRPRAERMRAIGEAWPIAAIFIILFVGIYGGFFTPTEGAAVATTATLLLALGAPQARLEADRRMLSSRRAVERDDLHDAARRRDDEYRARRLAGADRIRDLDRGS